MASAVQIGDCVEVFGLTSEGGKELNGLRGILVFFLKDKGRFEVRLAPDRVVSVKPDNLKKIELTVAERLAVLGLGGAAKSEDADKTEGRQRSRSREPPGGKLDDTTSSAEQTPKEEDPRLADAKFKPGHCVEVFGLESANGKKFNNQSGIIVQYLPDTQRYQVRFIPDYVVSLNGDNLRKMEFKFNAPNDKDKSADDKDKSGQKSRSSSSSSSSRSRSRSPKSTSRTATNLAFSPGDAVEVFGLESAEGKALNGQNGVITIYVEEKSRFEIRLASGIVKHFKPVNLKKHNPQPSAAAQQDVKASEAKQETTATEGQGPDVKTPEAVAKEPSKPAVTSLASLLGLGRAEEVADDKPAEWQSVWSRSGGGKVASVTLSKEEVETFESLVNAGEDRDDEIKALRQEVEAEMHAAGVYEEEMLEQVYQDRLKEFKMMKALRPQGSPTAPKTVERSPSRSSSSSSSSSSSHADKEQPEQTAAANQPRALGPQ